MRRATTRWPSLASLAASSSGFSVASLFLTLTKTSSVTTTFSRFAEENDYNLDSWYLNFQPTEQASCGWETECTEVVDTYQTECQYFWQGCGDGYEQVERSSCKLGWWDWARTGSERTCERVERVCQ